MIDKDKIRPEHFERLLFKALMRDKAKDYIPLTGRFN